MKLLQGPPPEKPSSMNGDHEHIWAFMWYLNGKIDKVLWAIMGTALVAVIANIASRVFIP